MRIIELCKNFVSWEQQFIRWISPHQFVLNKFNPDYNILIKIIQTLISAPPTLRVLTQITTTTDEDKKNVFGFKYFLLTYRVTDLCKGSQSEVTDFWTRFSNLIKNMFTERNFVFLVTELELLSPWCFAGCTSMKNKSHKI